MHTRASRESPSPLSTKRRVLYEWEKEKKFNFVPSSLSLTHNYYLILSVKCVCSLFFLSRARWTTATACKLEAMFNHVLKLENVNIYIYNIPHFNSEFFSIEIENVFFHLVFISFCWYHFKKPFSTLIWIGRREKNEEEQTKPAAIKIRVPQNRIEWNEHIKCINRFLYLNLQIKNFLSLSHSLYIHIKNILKKLKRELPPSVLLLLFTYTYTISMFLFSGHDARLLQWERTR